MSAWVGYYWDVTFFVHIPSYDNVLVFRPSKWSSGFLLSPVIYSQFLFVRTELYFLLHLTELTVQIICLHASANCTITVNISTLKIDATCSSETPVCTYKSVWYHNIMTTNRIYYKIDKASLIGQWKLWLDSRLCLQDCTNTSIRGSKLFALVQTVTSSRLHGVFRVYLTEPELAVCALLNIALVLKIGRFTVLLRYWSLLSGIHNDGICASPICICVYTLLIFCGVTFPLSPFFQAKGYKWMIKHQSTSYTDLHTLNISISRQTLHFQALQSYVLIWKRNVTKYAIVLTEECKTWLRRRWNYAVIRDSNETGRNGLYWAQLAHGERQWTPIVNITTKLWDANAIGNLLTWMINSLWERLLHISGLSLTVCRSKVMMDSALHVTANDKHRPNFVRQKISNSS